MRLHVVGLPHTHTTRAYDWCAYTAKVRRFCQMMSDEGYGVVLYGSTDNEADVDELVVVADPSQFTDDWETTVFDRWDPRDQVWRDLNAETIAQLSRRADPGDALCIITGTPMVATATVARLQGIHVVEFGVGYAGILDETHHVFESRCWQAHVAGYYRWETGRFFDTVIPNSFDPDDLMFGSRDDGYLLYLGRPNPRKGLRIVQEVQRRTGLELHVAGQRGYEWEVPVTDHGVVLGKEKAQLLSGARCLLAPTEYIEPFGGVAVEAMLSGTPAITTDWGAFPETVLDGVSGFRCSTLGEFVDAVDLVGDLDRHQVAAWADQFSVDNVARRYRGYFERLALLDGDGWYTCPEAPEP